MTPWLYCPHCGARLAPGGACPACEDGRVHVRRTAPAVALAVVEDGRILLVRRKYEPMVGHWALPAGFIEGHEAPAATARREAAEETGLIIRPLGLLGAFPGGGADARVVLLVYRGVVEGGTLCPGDDATDAGFFALGKPPQPFAYGPHRQVLALLQAEWEQATHPGSTPSGTPETFG
jgi:ADP-ribose pyrophosphatase YjhB (NUDIX family)